MVYVAWKAPPHGAVKLNTDGSSHGNPGMAGAGGLLRDHLGRFIAGFSANIGISTGVTAECRALELGLELAWNMGFRRILIEVDLLCSYRSSTSSVRV